MTSVTRRLVFGDYSPLMYFCPTHWITWKRTALSGAVIGGLAWAATGAPIEPPLSVEATWPMFHGSPDLRGVAPGTLGTRFEIAWEFQAPEAVTSSPIVVGGVVYVGCDDGRVFAIDAVTGEQKWAFATQGRIEATPLYVDGLIVIGSADFNVYAIDAVTGEERWRFETSEKIVGSANVLRDGSTSTSRVVVGSHDNFVYCLDSATGREVWKVETASFVNATPTVSHEQVIIGGCDSSLHVLDGASGSGRIAMTFKPEEYIAGSASVVDGVAYFGHYGNAFVAVNIATGETVWSFAQSRFPFYATPAVTRDFVITTGRDRYVYCFNRVTGEIVWKVQTRRAIDSSPVACDEKVVVGTGEGKLLLLDLVTGERLWSWDLGEPITSSPAVLDGRIYIGCNDGRVYAFKAVETTLPREQESKTP